MEARGTEPGGGARAGEDPGVGGRGWAGPRGAARPKRSGRRTRRDQEAAALRPRPEVSGAAPGKGSARSPRPLPMTGFQARRPRRARDSGRRRHHESHLWIGRRPAPGGGGADLGHLDRSPETDGQGRPLAPDQPHLGRVAGMGARGGNFEPVASRAPASWSF